MESLTSVPEEHEWHRGPFGSSDYFWAAVEERMPIEEIPSTLLMELENDRCSLIAPISILCFNLERGEFSLSIIYFESGSALTTHMDRWTKYVIKLFWNILDEMQVLLAIHSPKNLSITS